MVITWWGVKVEELRAYVDGACSGNPGAGGWGVALFCGNSVEDLSGYCDNTTNNRMELMAAIEAIKRAAALNYQSMTVITDSVYVKNGITQWIHSWKLNSWRTADKKPVKNVDLWQQLDLLREQVEVRWMWVKGHSGDVGNERADDLARAAIARHKNMASAK